MSDVCEGSFYLIAGRKPRWPRALDLRMTAKSPALKAGEVAIRVEVKLPIALFVRPQLRATVTVPEDSVSPAIIDAEVVDNIASMVSQSLGIDLTISTPEQSA